MSWSRVGMQGTGTEMQMQMLALALATGMETERATVKVGEVTERVAVTEGVKGAGMVTEQAAVRVVVTEEGRGEGMVAERAEETKGATVAEKAVVTEGARGAAMVAQRAAATVAVTVVERAAVTEGVKVAERVTLHNNPVHQGKCSGHLNRQRSLDNNHHHLGKVARSLCNSDSDNIHCRIRFDLLDNNNPFHRGKYSDHLYKLEE
jgi:hypothetical protein